MIIKMIDKRKTPKNTTEKKRKEKKIIKKKQRQTKAIGDRSHSERVRGKWFCCAIIFSPANM